jgi:peptide/nickel transport system ATP-binding protein
MKKLTLFFTALILFSPTSQAFEFSYDKGIIPPEFALRALPGPQNVRVVKGIGSRDRACAEFNLSPGELALGAGRAELVDTFEPPLHQVQRFYFSTFIPEDYPIFDKNSTVIAQWHTQRPFKPPMAFRYRDGRLDITLDHFNRNTADPKLSGQITIGTVANFRKGRWHDFVGEVIWSPDSTGKIQVWVDGFLVAKYNGMTTYFDETIGPYFKYGIYVSKPLKQTVRLYHGAYTRQGDAGS